MRTVLNPYLNFRGNTREAMEWYQGVFGGDLSISAFAELHGSMDPSEEAQLRGYFDKLAARGNVLMPLEKAVWGDTEFQPDVPG